MNAPACCAKKWPRNLLRLLLSCGVLVVVSTGAFAQRKPLTPTERKDLELRLEKMQPLLDEFHQGKRDDSDGHAIIRKMLQYYSILGSTNTATYQGLLKEWQSLRQKHPEFVTSPPLELHEHAERRAGYKKHSEDIAEKAKHFMPADCHARIFWSGKHVAMVFQHRIDFFDLADGVQCMALREKANADQLVHEGVKDAARLNEFQPIQAYPQQGRGGALDEDFRFMRGNSIVQVKPYKTIRFAGGLAAAKVTPSAHGYEAFGVVASGNGDAYGACNNEEWEVQQVCKDKSCFHMDVPAADFQTFYGVVGIDGKILTQFPFTPDAQGSVLRPLYSYPDGTSLFDVGKNALVPVAEGDGGQTYAFQRSGWVIAWSKDKGLQQLSIDEAEKQFPLMKRGPAGFYRGQ